MKNVFIILGLIILVVGGLLIFRNLNSSFLSGILGKNSKVTIKDQTFSVKVVQTDADKQKGLSGTQSLPQNQGVLFTFAKADYYPFWMKDMLFSIDIIYINKNKIVNIIKSAPVPKSKTDALPVYSPTGPADNVLEINAGLSDKYKFSPGDTATISL